MDRRPCNGLLLTLWRSFIGLYRSFINLRSLKGLLSIDLLKPSYRTKTKELLKVFYPPETCWRSPIERRPKTFRRSSIDRILKNWIPSRSLMIEDLSKVFCWPKTCWRSFIDRRPFFERSLVDGLLSTEDLLAVFYRPKTCGKSIDLRSILSWKVGDLLEVFCRPRTSWRASIDRRPIQSFLSTEGLLNSFYGRSLL